MRALALSAGLAGIIAGCKSPKPDYENTISIIQKNSLIMQTEGRKNGKYYWDSKTYGPETPEYQYHENIRKQHPGGYEFVTVEPVENK